MARIRRRINVTFPVPGDRYDKTRMSVFIDELERVLYEVAAIAAEEAVGGAIVAFTDADTTPSVSGGTRFSEANTGVTSITAFDDGVEGQEITILFTTANTTIVDGANLHLSGGANFVGSADDILVLFYDGTSWYEVSRSVN